MATMNVRANRPVIVIGAGAAGLMAARVLAEAGCAVTILEAQSICGGRIRPQPEATFGYAAEGGAEFIHGEAPVTRALMREAGLSLQPITGTRWTYSNGAFSNRERDQFDRPVLRQALEALTDDVPLAEFLRRHVGGEEHRALRRAITGMVEGYDAADPEQVSTFAIRDEWMKDGHATGGRIQGGYGRLVDFLLARCRALDVAIHQDAVVTALDVDGDGVEVRCADGNVHTGSATILTVPVPLLSTIAVPKALHPVIADAARRGFGNVIKLLLRFERRWWADDPRFHDLTFLMAQDADVAVPVWWTQAPADSAVLTGWLGGPQTRALAGLDEQAQIRAGLASLAAIFDRPMDALQSHLVAARAFDWSREPFARGAYSYAVPAAPLNGRAEGGLPFVLAGEALDRGPDMGTVEAALASGRRAANHVLKLRDR